MDRVIQTCRSIATRSLIYTMLTLTFTEENYLKSIYALQQKNASGEASVNEIAGLMNTKPATVTDMLRKLSDKELIHYEKYKKVKLSDAGRGWALQILRKHRLWETFLFSKLQFSWDEVHEVAEQLEHIHSVKLIEKLDEFLGFPKYDPHGDPIPGASGEMPVSSDILLKEANIDTGYFIVGVKDTSAPFLQQLERFGVKMGIAIEITEKMPFDNSLMVMTTGRPFLLSEKIAENILVNRKKRK